MGRDRRSSNNCTPAWANGLIFGEPSKAAETAHGSAASSPMCAAPVLPPPEVPMLQSFPPLPTHACCGNEKEVGCSLPELRMAPPESMGGEKELWRLPPSPHSASPATGDRILIVKRFGMFHAFEVLPGMPDCDVASAGCDSQRHNGRSSSCPAAFGTHENKIDGFKHNLSLGGDAFSISTQKPTEHKPQPLFQGDTTNGSSQTTPHSAEQFNRSSNQEGSQGQHENDDSGSKDLRPAEPIEEEAASSAVSNGRFRSGKKGPRKVLGHANESASWTQSYNNWYPSHYWSSKHMRKASSAWWTSGDW